MVTCYVSHNHSEYIYIERESRVSLRGRPMATVVHVHRPPNLTSADTSYGQKCDDLLLHAHDLHVFPPHIRLLLHE